MRAISKGNRGKDAQAGISMIELLIAGAVMVVGFMAVMLLVLTAIASNNRNRLDSTATMLGQSVIEDINATLISATGSKAVTDCAGTSHTINAAPDEGAALSGADIDFSQTSPPANYHMNFAVCGVGGTMTTYDVRWHIKTLTTQSFLVTVGVKMKGAGTNLRYFALPVTLRTYVASKTGS